MKREWQLLWQGNIHTWIKHYLFSWNSMASISFLFHSCFFFSSLQYYYFFFFAQSVVNFWLLCVMVVPVQFSCNHHHILLTIKNRIENFYLLLRSKKLFLKCWKFLCLEYEKFAAQREFQCDIKLETLFSIDFARNLFIFNQRYIKTCKFNAVEVKNKRWKSCNGFKFICLLTVTGYLC